MAKEKFKDSKLNGTINIKLDSEKGNWVMDKNIMLNNIISICESYFEGGDIMTLRQLYYQLVAKDLIPNHFKVYKKIGALKDELVYAGLLDWDIFEDRGRVPHRAYFENNIKGALNRTKDWYTLNRQLGQPTHIEVWTEKDAISGILKNITNPYTIRLAVNKGYTSSTAIHEAYKRFSKSIINGQKVKVLYFGDHDPSGLDMIRDIKDRLEMMFIKGDQLTDLCDSYETETPISNLPGYENMDDIDDSHEWLCKLSEGKKQLYLKENDCFEIKHIGLTMDQIQMYNPPHNPAKIKDPRAKWYIEKFGPISWEVDALSPDIMRSIVKDSILEIMDESIYKDVLEKERDDKSKISKMIKSIL